MTRMLLLVGLLTGCAMNASAAARTFTVVTNAAVINHWPSSDRLIGTADDVVNGGLSLYGRSSANHYGSYSYIVTSFGLATQPDPMLFDNFDTATFVIGSATIDPSTFVTNDIPLVTDLQFSGTELFPGHGPYSLKLTNRRGGSYTHIGNLFSFTSRYDFEGTFAAGQAVANDAQAEGRVVVLDAAQYDAPDLSNVPSALADYIRAVAIPLAKSLNASGLLCGDMTLRTSGSVPGTPGFFPPLQGYAVVLAMDFSVQVELRVIGVQPTAQGVRLQWSAVPGATYTVQATESLTTPFVSIAENLAATEYVDTNSGAHRARFYRLRTQ